MKMFNKTMNKDKKESLLAQKQRLLQDLKYYEKRIEEAKLNANKNNFVCDGDSSDSDIELPTFKVDTSVLDLKVQQASLQTCLLATQELTGVEVLQSEVNLLVDTPDIASVTEGGVWKEVTAECCIDLVPFCITFLTHTPERTFAQTSYHKLQVTPVKSSHEAELNKSVLPLMTRPSDAVEVVRSYAAAYRSRRTTLARLADKFDRHLTMEPVPEGGIRLKCANLLEVHWTLQNKWSPITPFQHRLRFDLEYMDESYIKTITQAHKQLSNPELETNERTVLLATIVNTCLDARGPTQELHDSISSDPEGQTLFKKTTLTQKEQEPNMRKRQEKKDTNMKRKEVMAPPKSVPKKSKEKRKMEDDDRSQKRMKTSDNDVHNGINEETANNAHINDNIASNNDDVTKSNDKIMNYDEIKAVVKEKSDTNMKNKAKDGKNLKKQSNVDDNEKPITKKSKKNDEVSNNDKTDKGEPKKSVAKSNSNDDIEQVDVATKNKEQKDSKSEGKKIDKTKSNTGNTGDPKKIAGKNNELNSKTNKVIEAKKSVASVNSGKDNAKSIPKEKNDNIASEKLVNKKNNTDKNSEVKKSVASSKDNNNKNQITNNDNPKPSKTSANASSKNSDNNTENKKVAKNIQSNTNNKETKSLNKKEGTASNDKVTKALINKETNVNNKVTKALNSKETNAINNNVKKTADNIPQTKKPTENPQTQSNKKINKVLNKDKEETNEARISKTNTLTKVVDKNNIKNTKNIDKIDKENKNINKNKPTATTSKISDKNVQKSNINVNNKPVTNLKRKLSIAGDGNIVKKPVISKIPQVRSSPQIKGVKMPIRVSPRKLISGKPPIAGLKKTISSKIITNIPSKLL